MGHGTEGVSLVKRRNLEATAIPGLSTMRLDQETYYRWAWEMMVVMLCFSMLRREPLELGRGAGSLLQDR